MNRKRIGLCGLLSVALLLVAVEPVLAQSSINEKIIGNLNKRLLYVAIPITVLVEGILIYALWKFKDNDEATPTQENRRLEITWTIATAIILLFVGVGSMIALGSLALAPGTTAAQPMEAQQTIEPAVTMDKPGAVAPPNESVLEVEVIGSQWSWTMKYPEANVTTSGKLVLPANRTIYIHTTSTDVVHSIHIPALALKMDSFPARYRTISTKIIETGKYQLYCAEFCGAGHSAMLAKVVVKPPEKFQSWINSQQSSGSSSGGSSASGGSSSSNNSSTNSSTNSSAMDVVPANPT